MKLISGAVVEGWKWGQGGGPDKEWTDTVTHYSVEFSPDGRLWTVVKDDYGLPRHFRVEREHKSVRKNYSKAKARYQAFDPFLHARFFRLKIRAWRGHQCLTLELYGCDSYWAMENKQLIQRQKRINIEHCHYLQPIEVKYWQLTPGSAASTRNYGKWGLGSEMKWCVAKNRPKDSGWLEFDLLYPRFISRIVVTLTSVPEKEEQDMDFSQIYVSLDGREWKSFGNHDNVRWIEIDMRKVFAVTRIIFLGAKSDQRGKECLKSKSAKLVNIHHSIDGRIWSLFGTYNQLSGDKSNMGLNIHFEEKYGPGCFAMLDIMPTIYARHIHFHQRARPKTSGVTECLALDIFGNEPGNPRPYYGRRKPGCNSPLGMESKKIKDSQIKVSTFSTSRFDTRATNARLNSNGGWCVKTMLTFPKKEKKFHIPNEYLEIDLLSEKFIDGFATQGHSSYSNGRWVTGYVVHYSLNGFSWDVISAEERETSKVYFVANKNRRDTVRQYLNPRIRARFVRFVPVAWHNWICMRAEIYGCDAGESLQDKLEKKLLGKNKNKKRTLLEINKERLQLSMVVPGLLRNKYRDEFNLFYGRTIVGCGTPDREPWWGNYRYLAHLLDHEKTFWVQQAFNNEFNASGYWLLFLHELRVLKTKSAKHFVCKGIMKDGTELYRHHVIASKIGFEAPDRWDPGNPIYGEPVWNTLFESPTIIVQQRIDVAYDGGKPIWKKPAVVYASGPVASIGVIVTGIPYLMAGMPRSYISDRKWSLSYLGQVPHYKHVQFMSKSCSKLAQFRGYDHFVLRNDQCYSSHALPANVYKKQDLNAAPDKSQRDFNVPYFLKGMRKFQTYEIAWYKLKANTVNQWIQIFKYQVKDPDRETSLLFTLETIGDDLNFNYLRARGRYRAYDKTYFGDYFSASHVLEIDRLTTVDLGTYKVMVRVLATGAWSEAIIELRHEEEPRISLPETFGACAKAPTEVKVTMNEKNFRDPNTWKVNWYHWHRWYGGWKRSPTAQGSTTLRVPKPLLRQTGEWYEVEVRNQFGFAKGVSKIIVIEDVPTITWITPSPHFAAKDVSDVLEVKIENDKTLVRVDWYHNGTLIERTTEGFAFPGEKHGSTSFRKKLKLSRISFETAGTYRVVAKGKYCQFEKNVEVRVIISPRLIVKPHAVYLRSFEGESEVNMNITIKGGVPKPMLDDMEWKKGSQLLTPSRYGRVILETSLNKKEDWFTVLIIRNLKESDSGDYTFTVKTGPATKVMTKSLVVIPKHEYFSRKNDDTTTTTDSSILETLPSSTPSSASSFCPWSTMVLSIYSVLLVIEYLCCY
ncbi:uncharacterized protein [Porites lutea]|uniref:uncharacterized protein n=1 Tax=Porites lutea TaxID=51062 RepID=UPI003CC6A938